VAQRPKRATGGGGAGTLFVVIGCLAILGGAFGLGVMAGRAWPQLPFARSESAAKAPRGREREARAPEAPPTLTFYQELTAPLTAPPPPRPVKPARAEAPKAEAPKLEPPRVETPREPAKAEPAKGFTVQVGAYKTREPAEGLRARLAAAGHEAYVAETDGAGGARFRVRVGAFASREAAQEAATRIAADRTLSTFVTAR
jgi:DedD protein